MLQYDLAQASSKSRARPVLAVVCPETRRTRFWGVGEERVRDAARRFLCRFFNPSFGPKPRNLGGFSLRESFPVHRRHACLRRGRTSRGRRISRWRTRRTERTSASLSLPRSRSSPTLRSFPTSSPGTRPLSATSDPRQVAASLVNFFKFAMPAWLKFFLFDSVRAKYILCLFYTGRNM